MTNEYSILANMYFNGSVEHDEHGMIKVGEYIINFEREEVQMNFLQNNYQYRCNIIIHDLTGREIRRIVINEFEAMQMLDGINAYIYDDFESEVYLLSNIAGPTLYETYTLCLQREYFDESDPNNNTFNLVLNRYNGVLEVLETVLTIRMTLSELDSFVDTAFFIFLIDIASSRTGIFSDGG